MIIHVLSQHTQECPLDQFQHVSGKCHFATVTLTDANKMYALSNRYSLLHCYC